MAGSIDWNELHIPKIDAPLRLLLKCVQHIICFGTARNLRRAGIAEGVIMKIGRWRTCSVFERYAIASQADIADAPKKLETS